MKMEAIKQQLATIKNDLDASRVLPGLIPYIKKLNNNDLLTLFQSSYFPLPRYTGLVDLIARISSNDTALLLLNLIEKLPNDNLTRLFYGSVVYTGRHGEVDNLMRQIERFSPSVVTKALQLLRRLPAGDVEYLLVSGEGDWFKPFTPLDMAFAPRNQFKPLEQAELAIAFIDTLSQSYLLRPLLVNTPHSNSEPFLHKLARHQILPAIAHYLEQPKLKIAHKNTNGETAFDIADNKGYSDVVCLFKARPLRKHLLNPQLTSQKKFDAIFEKIVQRHPGVLKTRWSGNKTLAHIAVEENNPKALKVLLRLGADANAKDEKQLSPLDYAINANQFEAINVLAACPQTTFTDVRHNGTLPLPQLLGKCEQTTIEGIIANLRKKPGKEEATSFAVTLMQLPKPRLAIDELKQELEKTASHKSRYQTLADYCKRTNDPLTWFLLHAGEVASTSSHPTLIQSAQGFMENHLTALSGSATTLEKESLRMQLVMFLFAMQPKDMMIFLKQLVLNSEQLIQLDVTICYALVQPLIFSSLTPGAHQLILDSLHDQQTSISTIAQVHFRRSNLSLLPPMLLQKLSYVIPESELFQHSKNRLNSIIIVLALDRELASNFPDKVKISELFKNLEHELTLFNQHPSTLSTEELATMLNLATSPHIQETIGNFLTKQSEAAPIKTKIDLLFTRYRKEHVLNKEGMLRKILLAFANTPHKTRGESKQAALTDLISIASSDEVRQIISSQQQAIQAQLLIASLLKSADTATTYKFSKAMYNLDNTTARIALTPFISRAGALGDEIQILANKLEGLEYLALKHSLTSLTTAFGTLVEALMTSQFEKTFPAWTSSLQSALATMLEACQIAIEELDKKIVLSRPVRLDNQVLQQLMSLIRDQATFAFPERLKQAFQNLDEEHTLKARNIQQALTANIQLMPLQSLFTLQKSDPNEPLLPTARKHQTSQLKRQITHLNNSLCKGVLENVALEELQPRLSTWQMTNGTFVTETSLITQIPTLITSAKDTTLSEISTQQDALLYHTKKSASLLKELQRLASKQSSLNDVLDIFYATDNETLTQFVALTAKTHVHDLNRLSQYVLSGKMHHWDIVLLNRAFANDQTPVTSWLPDSMASLAQVTSTALSVKALITGHYLDDQHTETRLNQFSDLVNTHKLPLTLDAITLFANSHATLLSKNLLSPTSQYFVGIFSELMQQSNAQLQIQVFASLPSTFITQLLEHTLSMIGSSDPRQATANKILLTCLCQLAQESQLLMIKKRLGSQDFKLLGDDCLISLAKEVLTEKSGLDDLTYDGVWIQRLLVSPRFVSACPSGILQDLTERYRALSLTLKQDEFERLNNFISGKLDFANQHREAGIRWQQELLANQETRERLLAKREQLLMFRADDSIRALYNQLEDNCFELRETQADIADKALDNLYDHHNKQLSSMRSDVLFRMADFVYSRAMRGMGDLPKAQSPLLSWLEKHLPHRNFQQAELERKSSVRLFNEAGEPIGYLDESNHAKALVNDQPVSLMDVSGWHAGSVLFDENRQRLGILTSTGQLKRENLFQEHTSALLVGKMPIEQLEKSPAALDLLLQDICNENAISTLYEAVDCKEKRTWLQQQITRHIQQNQQTLSAELIRSFVEHHPIESLLDALGNRSKPINAENLFNAILANDTKRTALFAMGKSPLITDFFKQGNQEEILTNFLIEHHSKPWFGKGLALITRHITKKGLLGNSLQRLASRVREQTLSKPTMDTILQTLLSTPFIAKTVLQEGSTITHFFSKQHLMPVVKTLNEQSSWERCPQYQLLLRILKTEHERLFPPTEVSLTGQPVWSAEDLQQMTVFATRHIRTKNNFDNDGTIGQSLLAELVFRCASFGQTALFYKKNGKLNTHVAGSHLQRSTLDALAARYYLVNYAKESLEHFINMVKNWFSNTDDEEDEHLDKELQENHALIDWKAMAKASWSHTSGTELPLIAAFLINYSGASAPVTMLVDDILKNRALIKNCDIVLHLSQIMGHYPHRDVSHIIFNALTEASIQNPRLINKTVLDNMVRFHTHAHLPNKGTLEPLEAELSLLTHFGQQKNYALTGHVAKLLYQPNTWGNYFLKCFGYEVSENDTINTLFGRSITEAQIESELQNNVERWFFGIQKTFKRWWHYGIDGMATPTGIVKFCDDESPYTATWTIPTDVKSLIPGGQVKQPEPDYAENWQRTHERYQAFINKALHPKDPPKEVPSPPKMSGLDKFGMFAEIKKVWDMPIPAETPIAACM